MESIAEMLIRLQDRDNCGVYFCNNDDEYIFMSYKELFTKCLENLKSIEKIGIRKGDKVIFQINDNKNLVVLFWTCVLGGIIPVPLTFGTNNEQINKLRHVFKLLDNSKIFIDSSQKQTLIKEFSKKPLTEVDCELIENMIVVEDIKTNCKEYGLINPGKNDDIAFIQFSSGSTDMAKGVMLTHNNLITNIEDIIEKGNILENDFFLSWLPLTHDMGMIGFHLTPMFRGINFLLMKTLLFLQKPMSWLEACSKFKATQTSSPNFGYKYFLSKFKKGDLNWDLSNLKSIFNGAEPIDVDLAEKFLQNLKLYGLKESAMYTVYGMAEACLGVTFPIQGEKMSYLGIDRRKLQIGEEVTILDKEDTNAIKFANVGTPLPRIQVNILDDEGNLLEQNRVGNICIKGRNVTKGYFKNEDYTKKNITQDGWLNTGDIGFIHEDCLYITGRKKDIIILNGYNYYAHDIERICENIPHKGTMQFVASAVYDRFSNEEKLGVFVKYLGNIEKFKDIADKIKQELYSNSGIAADYVIPVKTIYKTTSGKLKRYQYTREFIEGKYNDVIEALSNDATKDYCNPHELKIDESKILQVLNIIKEDLEVNEIDLDENLVNMGISSIKLMKIQAHINEIIPNELSVSDFYRMATVRDIIKALEKCYTSEMDKQHIYKEIQLNDELIDKIERKAEALGVKFSDILYAIYMYIHAFEKDCSNIIIKLTNENERMLEKMFNFDDIQSKDDLYKVVAKQIEETNIEICEMIHEDIKFKAKVDKTDSRISFHFANNYNEAKAKLFYENYQKALQKV